MSNVNSDKEKFEVTGKWMLKRESKITRQMGPRQFMTEQEVLSQITRIEYELKDQAANLVLARQELVDVLAGVEREA